ncbi:MAG: succinate dehydrogenase flavin-adding protein (antitoxin of CptAB toxin-antitoxin module) [Salibacteraceae bacterium]|jgi:succinate dehydrogenase flavin-adding protein (antitoxin of CptAB toxin-antitoxin module)
MKIIGTVILMLVLVACGGVDAPPKSTWSKKQLEEKKVIVKEVMEVHDITMAFMDKIHNSIAELEDLKSKQDSIIPNVDSAIQLLEIADERMMNWMRNYREPKDTIDYASAKQYLLKQKAAIQEVEVETNTALDFSSKLLLNANDILN